MMTKEGFQRISLNTVTQRITFPSVLDYVRFQLVAAPMASLLADHSATERESVIRSIASDTASFLDPGMLRDARLSFSSGGLRRNCSQRGLITDQYLPIDNYLVDVTIRCGPFARLLNHGDLWHWRVRMPM